MRTAELPPIDLNARADRLPAGARHTLVAGVLGAHLLGAWALMQLDVVRHAVAEAAPLFIDLLAPPAPPKVVPPPEPPTPLPKREAPPVIAATPAPSPEPPAFVAPPPPEPAPVMVVPEPAPAAPAPPAPPPPAPPPAEPKTIPATAVRYIVPPEPAYPSQSKRLREAGRVVLRVEIGTDGRARQVLVSRSSGHPRLDEAAAGSVRAARFAPYTENGVALAVWTLVPIEFELE